MAHVDLESELAPLVATEQKKAPISTRSLLSYVAVAALVGTAALISTRGSSSKQTDLEEADAGDLTFFIQSSYGSDVPGAGHYPWTLIAEPNKPCTLVAIEPPGQVLEEGTEAVYHWHLVADEKLTWGSSVEHTFTATGPYEVHLARYVQDASGTLTQTHHLVTSVSVRYIKREIRSLSEDDREAFLTALHTVFTTSTSEGQATYGANFVGISDLVKQHLEGAADMECDHWHDDAGIMTHHLGFTLVMEKSLQAVDASVTIPYWEYTRDAYELGTEWRDSVVFTESWFGNSGDSLGDNHYITRGLWSDLKVLGDASQFSSITNAYGQLRSPWNLNSAGYVTRFNKVVGSTYMSGELPSCSTVKACFDSASLAEMNTCLNGATHGPVHVLLGGQWDVEMSTTSSEIIGAAHLLLFKNLWRQGYARCTSYAQVQAGATASCSINSVAVEAAGGAYATLLATGTLKNLASNSKKITYNSDTGRYSIDGLNQEETEAAWTEVLEKLGSPGSVGEMYTSAAPYDPLFWVIHTTAERLLQYRRLRSVSSAKEATAISFDQTWGYTHIESDSDFGLTCDWSSADAEDLSSMPTCSTGTCPGHDADDILPFDLSAYGLSAKITNQQLYDWLDPTNEDVPYVYDSFTYDHCAAQGILIGSTTSDSTSPPPTM